MEKVQSTCNFCAIDCNLDFYVEDDRITKVVPTEGYPVNKGFACIKGLNLDKQQSRRHGSPLPKVKQEDGSYRDVPWETGFRYVADKIKELQSKYGRESVAGISTGQLTLEEFAIYGHVMRNFLKTNVDGNTRLCMATAVVAHKQSFGFDAPGFTLEDLELSDTIILVGSNPVVTHPIIWDKISSNHNKRLIVIDPRRSETAKLADFHYDLRWKSDIHLFYTLAHVLITKGAIDKEAIENSTNDFASFKEFVQDYTLDKVRETTDLSPDSIVELAELIENGERVSFWWTMGVNQGYEAVRTAQAIINIALMTGNIGREGTGANSITGQSNAMGSRAYSNTTGLFGGGDYTNPARRQAVAEALGMEEGVLATKPTIPYNQIVEGINKGEIKGLWILCTNPRHSWINNETFRTAMEKLEFLIVQDIHTDIESAEGADVLFPVVPGIKKEGTFINLERRLSPLRPALKRRDNEKSDYEVVYSVGAALGMGDLLKGFETPRDCFNTMRKCSKGTPLDITGVTWEMLEGSKGVQWPFREGETLGSDNRRLYTDGKFFTPNGKANFIFEPPGENPLPTNDEFPFILNTGRGTLGQWHTQTRTREIEFVNDITPQESYVFINTKLAGEHGLEENDEIIIHSVNTHKGRFKIRITEDVKYKELFAPLHYIECNRLTPSVYDPYSKEPSYKATPVKFEVLGRP